MVNDVSQKNDLGMISNEPPPAPTQYYLIIQTIWQKLKTFSGEYTPGPGI